MLHFVRIHMAYTTTATKTDSKTAFGTPIQSPLLKLPIDMVQDVIVSDSLHLLHLGVMKRMLTTYKDGHNGYEGPRWSTEKQNEIDNVLKAIRTPIEFHRATYIRGLSFLSHWKGTEFAVFLTYVGIAVLKEFLNGTQYYHFVQLFIAVTLCSTDQFKAYLGFASEFRDYISMHYKLFNIVASNTHNLIHVASEVQRFGPLDKLSSYAFENSLYQIKRMLRSGYLPLQQVVNRMHENEMANINFDPLPNAIKYPLYRRINSSSQFDEIKVRDGLTLNIRFADKWFLAKEKKIVAMVFADKPKGICACELFEYGSAFTKPLNSNRINVFKSVDNHKFKKPKIIKSTDVLCKLFPVIRQKRILYRFTIHIILER